MLRLHDATIHCAAIHCTVNLHGEQHRVEYRFIVTYPCVVHHRDVHDPDSPEQDHSLRFPMGDSG